MKKCISCYKQICNIFGKINKQVYNKIIIFYCNKCWKKISDTRYNNFYSHDDGAGLGPANVSNEYNSFIG